MPVINDDFDEGQLYGEAALAPKPARPAGPPQNPLAPWFRAPGVHIKIPSNGAFLPPGTIEFTMTGDLPVYPMRGADELLLKSPDALMSGYAIEELIRSCVPAIKTPRLLSSPDMDVLLLAIRAATFGEVMTFHPVCPSCGEGNESRRNLSFLLSNMKMIEKNNPVRLSDEVVVYMRPYNLSNATKIGLASFEEARKIQAMEQSDVDPAAKSAQINSSMRRISDLTMEAMADCIMKVVIPNQEVVDPRNIRELINNVSKPWTDAIQVKLDDLNTRGIDKHYDITCSSCEHKWSADIEFNHSTFFEASSSVSPTTKN